jgi:hypothetical protein
VRGGLDHLALVVFRLGGLLAFLAPADERRATTLGRRSMLEFHIANLADESVEIYTFKNIV